jgi:hypothetical protein
VAGIYELTTAEDDVHYRTMKLFRADDQMSAQTAGTQAEGLLGLLRDSDDSDLEELFANDNLTNGPGAPVGKFAENPEPDKRDRASTLTSQSGA